MQSLLLPLRILKIYFQQKSLHRLTHRLVQTVNNAVHNAYYCCRVNYYHCSVQYGY